MRAPSGAALVIAALLSAACAHAPAATTSPAPESVLLPASAAINAGELRARLFAFANDTMMGREAGTIWNERATAYVAGEFQRLGLQPAGEQGTFFQTVPNIRSRDPLAMPGLARNVIAIVPGTDPALRGEYVSITAHNDHLGYRTVAFDHDSIRAFNTVVRPLGADSPRREATPEQAVRVRASLDSLRAIRKPRADSVYNGADDDGSGTVALLAIAQAFMNGSIKPRRSILFVSHTAEEEGLLGSAWYTDHATVPLDSIVAEIDVDMIGRGSALDNKAGGPTYLEVVGLRRLSKEFGDMVESVNAREPTPFVFDYEYDAPGHPQQYYCRADHYSYARYGIPSVSLSRGSHMDYHQLTDEPQYIDYPDYTRLTQMVFDVAQFVANAGHRPALDAPKPADPHVPCRQ